MNEETEVSPRRQVLVYAALAVAVLAVVAGVALYLMRGSHLELTGTVKSVRSLGTDDTHALAIADFTVTNVAGVPWTVRHVAVTITTEDGMVVEGQPVAEIDAQRVFDYYPALGKKLPTLRMKETLKGHETQERMIAAQFELTWPRIEKRKRIVIRIDELDGASSEISLPAR